MQVGNFAKYVLAENIDPHTASRLMGWYQNNLWLVDGGFNADGSLSADIVNHFRSEWSGRLHREQVELLVSERNADSRAAIASGCLTSCRRASINRKYSSSFDAPRLHASQLGTVKSELGRGLAKRFCGGTWSRVAGGIGRSRRTPPRPWSSGIIQPSRLILRGHVGKPR